MKDYDYQESNYSLADPIDNYFECISSCDISDGSCISECVALLRDFKN